MGTGSEYFLVENRTPDVLWDQDIMPGGLAIYHIDESKLPGDDPLAFILTIVQCVQCDAWSPLIMLEQADGLFELQKSTGNRDDAGDLFHAGDSFPASEDTSSFDASTTSLNSNYYSGVTSGIAIDSIIAEADGSFSFNVTVPTLDDPCIDLRCPENTQCADGFHVAGLAQYQDYLFFGNRAKNNQAGLWQYDLNISTEKGPFNTSAPPHELMIVTP